MMETGKTALAARVEVWHIPLDLSAAEVRLLEDELSPAEQERARRMRVERPRGEFIQAHAALRRILGLRLGVDGREVGMENEPAGRPRLAGNLAQSGLDFNLAHTRGLALLALGANCRVGVDVEMLRDLPEQRRMGRLFLSEGEQVMLQSLPETERNPRFFQLWCCKEALVKASGAGFAVPPARVEVDVTGTPPRLVAIPGMSAGQGMDLFLLEAGDGYAAALAVQRGAQSGPKIEKYSFGW